MVLPLMGIFAAISAATELFDVGKKVYQDVTGEALVEDSIDGLQAAVHAMPPEQAQQWTERMEGAVKMYQAQNERLKNEQGEITDELVEKVDPETASKIAYLRMATRPEVVRMMAQYIMLPLYVMVADGYLAWCNIWLTFFGWNRQLQLLASTFFDANSTYYMMYEAGVVPATSIVLTYMTLRQMQKGVKANPITGVANAWKAMKTALGK